MKKRWISMLLTAALAVSLAACGGRGQEDSAAGTEETAEEGEELSADISIWAFQVGNWSDEETMDKIIASFNAKYPNIHVTAKALDFSDGDAVVQDAIDSGTMPDIVMEGPERLVSNWAAQGVMADLNDLWDDETVDDISSNSLAVVAACIGTDGNYYEYPLCMNAHCMAVNKEVFEAAGALRYIDDATRTWSTKNFERALKALKAHNVDTTGIIYCGGQGGDQGTRALVMNLYNAQFTNGAHTVWTMNSEAGIKGIQKLQDLCSQGLLSADPTIVASDELKKFAAGEVAMTFCWNASNRMNYAQSADFTPYAVSFPSEDGKPELAGGIYGFGVFDNGDENRIAAAKAFIKYVCDDSVQGPESVKLSGFFPVRASFGDVYANTDDAEVMAEFSGFMPYLGDYYNVTPGWAEQRTAWWKMLQRAFSGDDAETILKRYTVICNNATDAVLKKF